MSDATSDFDLRAIIAKIDRDLAESGKLREEANKFQAEQRKLIAEAQKLARDRWLAPVLAVVTVVGGLAGFASAIVTLMRVGGAR